MRIGVPKEIKVLENRVGLTPESVREVVAHGHEVVVERDAGQGIGMSDDDYRRAGATVLATAGDVFDAADMIVKVKEPQAEERRKLRAGQVLFTYLHLAPDPEQASRAHRERRDLHRLRDGDVRRRAACRCSRRCRKSPGAWRSRRARISSRRAHGGKGILLGGVPGVDPGKVVVLGGGVVGTHAIHMALGMGADVWVLDRSVDVLRRAMDAVRPPAEHGVFDARCDRATRRDGRPRHRRRARSWRGCPEARHPRDDRGHEAGSVVVDVAIDQGGCFETSHATTHAEPTYVVDGVIHYCVANMPGAVPRTSTFALNNATLPYVLALATKGWKAALTGDIHLRNGLNVAAARRRTAPSPPRCTASTVAGSGAAS